MTETLGNPEDIAGKTEWDSLEKEVPFNEFEEQSKNKESLEESKELPANFIEEKYGDTMKMILFEGDNYRDKHEDGCYTTLIQLEAFGLSDNDQSEIIKACLNDESLSAEIAEKVKNVLSNLAENSSMKEELKDDPFLRKRRVENLVGEKDSLSDNDELLRMMIWRMDESFLESEEVRDMLSDDRYIDSRYGLKNIEDEDTRSKKRQDILSSIKSLVESGDVTVEEMYEDPYQRKAHFDALLEIEETDKIDDKKREVLWNADNMFLKSYEYGECLAQRIKSNPDIYTNVDDGEVDKLTTDALEKITPKQFAEITKVYEKDIKKGDQLLLQTLLPILGLDKNPPTLHYKEKSNVAGEHGFYSRANHSITVIENHDGVSEDVASDEPSKKNFFFELFKSKKLNDEAFDHMSTVAHELWHAHQWAGEGVDEERRKKYIENFAYYANSSHCFDYYKSQTLEKEAFSFGEKVSSKCRELYEQKKGKK